MSEQTHKSRRAPRPQKRFGRHSTKSRSVFRPPAHPGRWVAGILAAAAVVALALVWGNILKAKSDKYRADKEAGIWTLPPESTEHTPAALPDAHLLEIRPEGNVGDIVIAGSHDGVLLPLRDASGALYYQTAVGTEAGMAIPADAVPLSQDVARLDKRPLRSAGIYHVTCFSTTDEAVATYRRGLDLALLYEYAASGIDELLLFGLPVGDDERDALAVAFLSELRTRLSTLPSPPAVGVALPLLAFEGEADADETDDLAPYAGEISPARLGQVADYLALDLRDKTLEDMDLLLPRLGFVYRRHRLRILVNREAADVSADLREHGFYRVYEMRADA